MELRRGQCPEETDNFLFSAIFFDNAYFVKILEKPQFKENCIKTEAIRESLCARNVHFTLSRNIIFAKVSERESLCTLRRASTWRNFGDFLRRYFSEAIFNLHTF